MRYATIVLAAVTLLVLVFSAPVSLRNAHDRGGLYLFSSADHGALCDRSGAVESPGGLTKEPLTFFN